MNLYKVTVATREGDDKEKVYVVCNDRAKAEQYALTKVSNSFGWNEAYMFVSKVDLIASSGLWDSGSSGVILIVQKEE